MARRMVVFGTINAVFAGCYYWTVLAMTLLDRLCPSDIVASRKIDSYQPGSIVVSSQCFLKAIARAVKADGL